MTEKDLELFRLLLEANESVVYNFCKTYLQASYGEDSVIAKDTYLYAFGTIPITVVAHVDTVWDKKIKVIKNGKIWRGSHGLGADDRAGIFLIAKLIQQGFRPNVLFTLGEEIGGIGALSFIRDFKHPPNKTHFLIELDRRGEKDCVFYDCGNLDFYSYIESFGFKTAEGLFSDISFICPSWDIAGVNLSVGYNYEHTPKEYINIQHLQNTFLKVINILSEKSIPSFSFNSLSSELEVCQFCHRHISPYGEFIYNDKPLCIDCAIDDFFWCDNCGALEQKKKSKSGRYCQKCEVKLNVTNRQKDSGTI